METYISTSWSSTSTDRDRYSSGRCREIYPQTYGLSGVTTRRSFSFLG